MMILVSSCQKELSLENDNGSGNGGNTGNGGNNGTGLLTRMENKADANNYGTTDYFYDASNRLWMVKSSGKSDGADAFGYQRAIRASDGTMTGYVKWNEELNDSLYVRIDRDASKRVIASVRAFDPDFLVKVDSSSYKYINATTVDITSYEFGNTTPMVYVRNTLSGDLVNSFITKFWDDSNNTWGLPVEVKLSYDNKKAPLAYSLDEYLTGWAFSSGDRNVIKFEGIQDGNDYLVQTIAYTYNADGRPKNGTLKATGTGMADYNATLAFYYK